MRALVVALAVSVVTTSCTTGLSLTLTAGASEPEALAGEEAVVTAEPPPTSTATSTSTTSTTAPPPPLRLGFVGDVHMVRDLGELHPLAAVTPLLSAPDLTFANLETVVGDADEVGPVRVDKPFNFRSPPVTLDLLAEAGVDVVALANNHTYDHGARGATITADRVASSPLIGVGAGATAAEAYAPAFLDVGGRTVGVVSLSRVPCDWTDDPTAERVEVAWACDRFDLASFAAITGAVAGSDHTVVMLHAGVEVTDCPGPRLREVVSTWIDSGVDVVSISHPHVLQGVELVDGAVVLWSTGNFAFSNSGGRTGRSALFEVTLAPGADPQVRLFPTVLPGGVARPADRTEAAALLAEVSERSPGGSVEPYGVLRDDPADSRCD